MARLATDRSERSEGGPDEARQAFGAWSSRGGSYAAPCRKTSRPSARVGSDAEIRSHSGDDVRRMDEVAGDFLIPQNEIAVFSGVAFGPHSLELSDTATGVRHHLGQVDANRVVRCRLVG